MENKTDSLIVEDLHVEVAGIEILKGVSLEVKKGEVLALMGPNGSGKSTLSFALMGHPKYKITKGKIFLNGEDITEASPDERARKGLFLKFLKGKERTRTNIIEAFFRSTFLAWKTYNKTGKESIYVGYSPIVGVDADKIFGDFPKAIILHIVRNPYAAFAETKRRPVPYTLDRYTRIWNFMQLTALNFANAYPKQFLVVRYEDMVANKRKFFQELSKKLGILYSETMEYPSWNGKKLERQYPWGTINIPNDEVNKATIKELSKLEYERIKSQTQVLNKILGYDGI